MIAASPLATLLREPGEAVPVAHQLPTSLPEEKKLPGESKTSWKTEAQKAIDLLKAEIDRKTAEGTISASEQARLRLLLLSTGNIPDAAERIAGTDPALADFWEKQCRGLGVLLDADQPNADGAAKSGERFVTAVSELDNGLVRLKSQCPATIRKALFVEESAPFGLYRAKTADFCPGQTAFLYLELDNIVSRPLAAGHEIAVLCRWELLDAAGQPALSAQEQLCESRSESPLKDVVLNIAARLPEQLAPGAYRLRVRIADRNGGSDASAEQTLNLNLKRK